MVRRRTGQCRGILRNWQAHGNPVGWPVPQRPSCEPG